MLLKKMKVLERTKNCMYGMMPLAIGGVVVCMAMVASAAEIGVDADGSLRWLDYVGIAIQFGPLLVLAGIIAVGRQIADDLRNDIRSAAEAHRAAVEALREQQAAFLSVIQKLAEK